MPTARGGLGVAAVNGKIYAIGGLSGNTALSVNEEFTPALNAWTTDSPMPTARSGFAVAVFNDKIYCIGGTIGTSGGTNEYVGNNEVYDPSTDTWQTEASMPTPRADLSANVVNGKIYLVGGMGYSSKSPYNVETNITEVYDPSANTWSTAAAMPLPVYGYASAAINGKIHIIGGSKSPGTAGTGDFVNSNQVYDPQSNSWGLGANLPTDATFASAAATTGFMAPSLLYCIGGFNTNSFSNIVQVYNAVNNSWSNGASMPAARAYLGVAVVNDVLYAIGGFDGTNWLNTAEQYTPVDYGTTPPMIQIDSPGNETYSKVTLSYTVNRDTSWVGYSLDNKANLTVNGETELFNLTQGQHNIILYANDSAGNMGSSNRVFFSVDSLPPDITMLMPLNQSYGSTDLQLTFALNQNATYLAYSLDGEKNVTIDGNVTLAALTNGSHHVTIYVIGAYDIANSRTVYFNIAPFPTLTVVGVSASVIIVLASGYLLIPRKKPVSQKRKLPAV
ncbi:MAG: kelch repeat-containing protein [Candidatus Bathyarchaeia archaeon]|jgi:N-acetylneuraminic acid mutarotase